MNEGLMSKRYAMFKNTKNSVQTFDFCMITEKWLAERALQRALASKYLINCVATVQTLFGIYLLNLNPKYQIYLDVVFGLKCSVASEKRGIPLLGD